MKAEGPGYNGAASPVVRWQQTPAIVVSIRLLKEFALVTYKVANEYFFLSSYCKRTRVPEIYM